MTTTPEAPTIVLLTSWQDAHEAFRRPEFKQARFTESVAHGNVALPVLHGAEHRARRMAENPLFRRDRVVTYENDVFPRVASSILDPYLQQRWVDLVPLGMEWTVGIAALTAGIDLPNPSTDAVVLRSYVDAFNEALLAEHAPPEHARLAIDAGTRALEALRETFLEGSTRRREQLDPDTKPGDLLTVLVRQREALGLSDDDILHEVATFLVGGTHTSAATLVKTIHLIFDWIESHPADRHRILHDRASVQSFVYETLRFYPSNPTAERWALEDVTLASGVVVPRGARVVISITDANRDPHAFGSAAATFDPWRQESALGRRVGLSFGSGTHACIGQQIAGGIQARDGEAAPYGLVPSMVHTLLSHGARRHPTLQPVPDEEHGLPLTFVSYPIELDEP